MGNASLDRVGRKAGRCEQIVVVTDKPAVKIAGPAITAAKNAFDGADRGVERLITTERTERDEGQVAVAALRPVYDTVRSATLVNQPLAKLAGRAKSFTTPDDLLAGAVKLEDHLADVAGVDDDHPMDGQGASAAAGEA